MFLYPDLFSQEVSGKPRFQCDLAVPKCINLRSQKESLALFISITERLFKISHDDNGFVRDSNSCFIYFEANILELDIFSTFEPPVFKVTLLL